MALTDAQSGGTVYALAAAVEITLAGTVSKGDAVGYSSGWVRALATVATAIHGKLVALKSGVSGDVIKAAPIARIGGRFTLATVGVPIYVAEGTDNGKYTETKPSTTGDVNEPCGYTLSDTECLVIFGNPETVA